MENNPSTGTEQPAAGGAPAPEVLKPRAVDAGVATATPNETVLPASSDEGKKLRRRTYRPSHKSTFIALGVVVLILAINAVVLGFVLKSKNKADTNRDQVTINADVLEKIGVNRADLGSTGVQLTVGPDAIFNGKLTTAGDVSIGGQLKLNSKFSANDAALTLLQAGDTALTKLNVSGDSTLTTLNLRNALNVTGASQLAGPVTVSQLLTVSNNLNVIGNISVGGVLSTSSFVARDLASTSTITVGGHILTTGSTPGFGAGNALGSNGTAAISGNDTAGTVSISVGVSAAAGTIASISFVNNFARTPRIVISPVGVPGNFYITNATAGGFSISIASGLPPGGYTINYIVMQ